MLDREQAALSAVRRRPIFVDPFVGISARGDDVAEQVDRARRSLAHQLDRAGDDIRHQVARVRALSPAATLERGYAVLQNASGDVVTDPAGVSAGDLLTARVSGGRLGLRVQETEQR
jgi:exodeoxyribonuclease VII large subunit